MTFLCQNTEILPWTIANAILGPHPAENKESKGRSCGLLYMCLEHTMRVSQLVLDLRFHDSYPCIASIQDTTRTIGKCHTRSCQTGAGRGLSHGLPHMHLEHFSCGLELEPRNWVPCQLLFHWQVFSVVTSLVPKWHTGSVRNQQVMGFNENYSKGVNFGLVGQDWASKTIV